MHTVTDVPWTDRWQQPQLKDPKPVLAAGYDGSFGFGQQLVLTSHVQLKPTASARDAFSAASAPGSPMAVVATNDRASHVFSVGQFEQGHVGATGSATTDWYQRDNVQLDLHDIAISYAELQRVHFAPNVHGLVSGDAAYLPVIRHGVTGSGAQIDVVKGLGYLGGSLYLASGVSAGSLEQALTAAKLLSNQAGHAFAVTKAKVPGSAGANAFTVSSVRELQSRTIPSRKPEPDVRHTLQDLQLVPGSTAFLDELDASVLAIVQGSVTAGPVARHAAVGPTKLMA